RSRPTIWLFGGTVEQVVPIIAAATLEVEQPRFDRHLHLRMARITALSVSYLTPGSPLTKTVRCSGGKSPICCRIRTGISVNVSLFSPMKNSLLLGIVTTTYRATTLRGVGYRSDTV